MKENNERKVPMLAVIMAVLIIGTASAALVSSFFATTGTITVNTPLSITPTTYNTILNASEHTLGCAVITNTANAAILVELETSIMNSSPADASDVATYSYSVNGLVLSDVDGDGDFELLVPASSPVTVCISAHINAAAAPDTYTITTTAVSPTDVDFIGLENKGSAPNYNIIVDNTHGNMIYATSGSTFNYAVHAVGLTQMASYELIYYADPWAGNNPGASIGTGIAGDHPLDEANGELVLRGQANIGFDLPDPADENYDVNNHDFRGAPDFYKHATGAKVWLVTSSDYDVTNTKMTAWNQANYLTETELVVYDYP